MIINSEVVKLAGRVGSCCEMGLGQNGLENWVNRVQVKIGHVDLVDPLLFYFGET